ncbi:FAD-binding oxidoreductase [Alloacidobacterium dinghuense]|uniref:FAD-binding oxidoreductase n=1 Tax=Alloacidobacterium dinghuense TaxID=2763107 RepID=A0A7G8BLW7_9BACT|nr:FAD-dependent oxidoreductase [Alloacidobacterium dinghuense]QNI33537.1 FAD-binding oxidoreductase [Alloacidobacterium dinghuense]
MNPTYDAVVIGAGIVGAACAYELAREGMRVVIVERDIVGGGATAAGMGHIVVMDDSPAQLALTQYSQSLWNSLSPALPSSIEYDCCGTLWIAADEAEMIEVRRKHALYASANVPTQVLDSHALAEAEPNLRKPLAGALLVPSDAVLYPPCAASFLITSAQQQGADLMLGKTILSAEHGKVQLNDGTSISSAYLVHATGAGATSLLPDLPIKKRKGHLVITDRYPGFVRHQLVELGYLKSAHSVISDSVAFNVQPRRTGQLLIGSSRQYGAEDSAIDHSILESMLKRTCEYLPGIANLSTIRAWTGFRAATPDKLPLIGPTDDPTVFLATGHEGLGITTSLATARLLADSILKRTSAIPIDPYLPARFALETAHA